MEIELGMNETSKLLITVFRFFKCKSENYWNYNKMEDFVCLQQ